MKWHNRTKRPPIKRGSSESDVFIGRHKDNCLLTFVQYIDYQDGNGFHWYNSPSAQTDSNGRLDGLMDIDEPVNFDFDYCKLVLPKETP